MAVAVAVVLAFQPHTQPSPDALPVGAVRFLHEHPEVVHGRMFNPDHWGGYLLLQMPNQPVFIDSRHEFYGIKLVRDYLQVARGEPGWLDILERYEVRWTLMPTGHPLNQMLALRKGWRRVYADRTASVFCRD